MACTSWLEPGTLGFWKVIMYGMSYHTSWPVVVLQQVKKVCCFLEPTFGFLIYESWGPLDSLKMLSQGVPTFSTPGKTIPRLFEKSIFLVSRRSFLLAHHQHALRPITSMLSGSSPALLSGSSPAWSPENGVYLFTENGVDFLRKSTALWLTHFTHYTYFTHFTHLMNQLAATWAQGPCRFFRENRLVFCSQKTG